MAEKNSILTRDELRRIAASPEVRSAAFLTRAELAGLLGMSIPTIDRRLRDGALDEIVIRLGASVRFRNPLIGGNGPLEA